MMHASPISLFVEPLCLDRRTVGYRTVLIPAGEIDAASVHTLRDALRDTLLSTERGVWVDLSDVTFMDSSGVHALVEARDALEPEHRRLGVICLPGAVRRVLDSRLREPVLRCSRIGRRPTTLPDA